MSTSLLPEIDLNQAIEAHVAGLLAGAQERYTTQVGRAHSGLVKLASKAAARHDDATDANNAAADLLERFSDAVEANGDNIVAGIAESSSQSASQAAQVLELEGQVADLERSARRASNLQATIDDRDREIAHLKRQLAASQAEVQEFRDAPTQPNPLSERNRQLETEVNDLTAKLTSANQEKSELEHELVSVKQERDDANAKVAQFQAGIGQAQQILANDPDADDSAAQPQAPAAGPDSQSDGPVDPSTMIGGIQGQPVTPQPKKKGVFGRARDILS